MRDVDELRLLLNSTLERAVSPAPVRADDIAELSRAAVSLEHQPSILLLLSAVKQALEAPDVVSGDVPAADLRLLVDAFTLLAGRVRDDEPPPE